ncbi:hypothetical protein ACEWY4_013431 [Coilia grayii]|uniref:TOG domain-containing protein n=1 Tax=Coilia grayii TaxID=363190 RepID=A0ABD1JWA8_9TELE
MDFSRLKEGLSRLLAVKRKSSGSILQPMPRVLPPIGSAPQQQQQQQQSGLLEAASSSSTLPAAVDPALLELLLGDRVPSGTLKAGAPRPLGRRNLTGLDHAHPLQPLLHGRASRNAANGSSSSFMKPAPPAGALPLLRTSTVPTVPAPPQATKPLASNDGQFPSRVPRFRKTSTVSVATAVEVQTSVESVAVRKDKGRKVEEVKEVKKTVREVKQTRERERQQAKKVPQPARRSPVPHPEQTLLQAFRLLSTDDWEKKVEALNSIRRLCTHHTEVLLPRLHDLCLAVTKEVKNLRSMVSRVAMVTLAHLFTNLGQGMDAEAEGTAQVLLQKAGEANNFIREDAEMALSHMVLCVSPSRSMAALINTGLKHRCAAVRASAAQHLGVLAETVGSSRLLCGRKEMTDRFVHAISCFALDSAQEVRWTHARDTLALLASHPDIIKMVEKFAPKRDQKSIKDIINKFQCR